MHKKYLSKTVDYWKKHGAVIIKDIFSQKEIISVRKDIEKVFGYKKGGLPIIKDNQNPQNNEHQFLNFENIPFECSPSLNLVGVHP